MVPTGTARRDTLLAAALVAAAEIQLRGHHPVTTVAAAALGAVAWRARRPGLVLLVLAAVALLDALAGGVLASDVVATLVAVVCLSFSAGSRLRRQRLVIGCAALVVALTAADQVSETDAFAPLNDLFFYGILVAAPAVVGALLVARARQVELLRHTTDELARQRDAAGRLARAAEAERLGRAVDAALAERLRQIVAGAARAEELAARDPSAVPAALAEVEATARAALHELRDELGVLRSEPVAEAATPAAPAQRSRRWPTRTDLAMAAAAVPLALETSLSQARGSVVLDLLACAAQGAALGCLRRAPARAAGALLLTAVAQTAFLTPLPPTVTWLLPALLVAFATGAWQPLDRARAALVGVLIGGVAVSAASPAGSRALDGLAPSAVLLVAAWCGGRAARAAEHRAGRLADLAVELEGARAARSRLGAAEQRADVARELHDVGAHALTVVCLQAGAAQRIWDQDPEQAHGALRAVVDLAASSLRHLQESLDGELAALDALAGLGRALGLEVRVVVEGDVHRVPHDVARVAYRVVQEALTNAARHAARSRVEVLLRQHGELLTIDVRDSGPGPDLDRLPVADVAGSGVGLRGMRERVEGCAGELRCGPRPDGGFAVHARLPLPVPLPVPVPVR